MQERSDVPYAMPQCCMLLLGEGSEATEPYIQQICKPFQINKRLTPYILAVTALKASNFNSAVWGRIFIFCCNNRHVLKPRSKTSMLLFLKRQSDRHQLSEWGELQIVEYSKRRKQFSRSHVTKMALNEPIKFQ